MITYRPLYLSLMIFLFGSALAVPSSESVSSLVINELVDSAPHTMTPEQVDAVHRHMPDLPKEDREAVITHLENKPPFGRAYIIYHMERASEKGSREERYKHIIRNLAHIPLSGTSGRAIYEHYHDLSRELQQSQHRRSSESIAINGPLFAPETMTPEQVEAVHKYLSDLPKKDRKAVITYLKNKAPSRMSRAISIHHMERASEKGSREERYKYIIRNLGHIPLGGTSESDRAIYDHYLDLSRKLQQSQTPPVPMNNEPKPKWNSFKKFFGQRK